MATITMIKKGGYLEKLAPDRGIHLYSAKERFCCLDSNGNLKYFEKNSSDMEKKGTIEMKNVERVEKDATRKYPHLVVLHPKVNGARVFKFNAKNEEEQDEWSRALSSFLATELSDDETEVSNENENNNQSAGEEQYQDGCRCMQETESYDFRRESDATSGYGSTNTVNGSKASLPRTLEDPDRAHILIECPNCSTHLTVNYHVTESVRVRTRQPVEHTERPKSECLHSKTRHKVAVENGLADITEDEEGGKERCKTVPKSYKVTFRKESEAVKFNNDS